MASGQPRLDTLYTLLPHTPACADASFQLSLDEQKAIVSAFNNPETTQASGIRLAGQKFFTLQCNARSIYGKKLASTTKIDIDPFD